MSRSNPSFNPGLTLYDVSNNVLSREGNITNVNFGNTTDLTETESANWRRLAVVAATGVLVVAVAGLVHKISD
ncbi:MAG: hypothetical protein M3Q14_01280 [bacterium]|nr:hypothetical protein [bacterium]